MRPVLVISQHVTTTAIGDTLDAIIKHLYGDSTDLDTIVTKIIDIKRRYPKPQ